MKYALNPFQNHAEDYRATALAAIHTNSRLVSTQNSKSRHLDLKDGDL